LRRDDLWLWRLVFNVPTHVHAAYQLRALPHNVKKHILRVNMDEFPPLYAHERIMGKNSYVALPTRDTESV